MIFAPPPEFEFIERGFGFSSAHEPNEAVISYMRTYPGGFELTLTFAIGSDSSLHVALSQSNVPLSSVTVECITSIAFQSWHGERIFRIGFEKEQRGIDLRIHYDQVPSIHLAALAGGD